jgi:hypothetical protein
MDPIGKEYLRVCIELYKTPLSHRDDMHACKFDPNDYSLEFDDCGTAGWIESKEDTKKKRVFLDLIDSDLAGVCRCPRKLSTDEKNYLGLCIALWQTRLQYTKHVIEYIERDSQKKKYLSKKNFGV